MNTEQAYDKWSLIYDTNENKTRDLEALALREVLSSKPYDHCLEVGCGTGKNTEWLLQKCKNITAVDLSTEMLAKAQEKTTSDNIEFIQADINKTWSFTDKQFDLITFSLVLEHIENLPHIFAELYKKLKPGGQVYIGELHPFKQYSGNKARFDTDDAVQVVPCYTHHVSDFVNAAEDAGLQMIQLREYFDDGDRTTMPRILTLLFQFKSKFN